MKCQYDWEQDLRKENKIAASLTYSILFSVDLTLRLSRVPNRAYRGSSALLGFSAKILEEREREKCVNTHIYIYI